MNFKNIKNIILFGGGQLLVSIIEVLKLESTKFCVVTSQRHANAIIGEDNNTSFLEYLDNNGINRTVSDNINKDERVLAKIDQYTLGISYAAAWIFKKPFIDLFAGKLVNFHGARLPQSRGGGSVSWGILRSEKVGVSLIHQVDTGIDTGSILAYEEFLFADNCRTPIEFSECQIKYDLKLFKVFSQKIQNGDDLPLIVQPEYLSAYWPRLHTNTHGYIDWNWSLNNIERFICAFSDPYQGAITYLNGLKVRIKKCWISQSDGVFHPFQTGIVYRKNDNVCFIATEQGSLLISCIYDEDGHSIMTNITIGDRFYTPIDDLERAKMSRAIYTAKGLKTT
jgi:methionyl-tRNA formyltransferase